MLPEDLPAPGAVDARRFVERLGHGIERSQEDQHGEAEAPPDRRQRERRQHQIGVGQEVQALEPEQLNARVQQTEGREQTR